MQVFAQRFCDAVNKEILKKGSLQQYPQHKYKHTNAKKYFEKYFESLFQENVVLTTKIIKHLYFKKVRFVKRML